MCVTLGSSLNDGQWHSVQLSSTPGRLTIAVDKEQGDTAQARPSFPVTAGSNLFYGGKQKLFLTSKAYLKTIYQNPNVCFLQ